MSTDTKTSADTKLEANQRQKQTETAHGMSRSRVRMITQIAMMGAAAVILMLFEIPLPFAPSFYEIDFSEVPVLIGCFTMGPMAGVLIELVKVLLNLLINGTMTAGIGEAANFLIGCAFCVPAGLIYQRFHSRKGAVIGMTAGTAVMTIVGSLINAFVLLPAYTMLMGLSLETIIGMGTAVNPAITNITTLVLFAVVPFNLLKGVLVSIIVLLIYKKISPILKMSRS